jgi:hypothetical protein
MDDRYLPLKLYLVNDFLQPVMPSCQQAYNVPARRSHAWAYFLGNQGTPDIVVRNTGPEGSGRAT